MTRLKHARYRDKHRFAETPVSRRPIGRRPSVLDALSDFARMAHYTAIWAAFELVGYPE